MKPRVWTINRSELRTWGLILSDPSLNIGQHRIRPRFGGVGEPGLVWVCEKSHSPWRSNLFHVDSQKAQVRAWSRPQHAVLSTHEPNQEDLHHWLRFIKKMSKKCWSEPPWLFPQAYSASQMIVTRVSDQVRSRYQTFCWVHELDFVFFCNFSRSCASVTCGSKNVSSNWQNSWTTQTWKWLDTRTETRTADSLLVLCSRFPGFQCFTRTSRLGLCLNALLQS